ncbi:unnamed protein product, partial [Dicrocoelium dendriticum]
MQIIRSSFLAFSAHVFLLSRLYMPQPSPSIDWPTRAMFSRTLPRTLVVSSLDECRFSAGRGSLLRGTRVASPRDEVRFS